jgi:hypothetical protein
VEQKVVSGVGLGPLDIVTVMAQVAGDIALRENDPATILLDTANAYASQLANNVVQRGGKGDLAALLQGIQSIADGLHNIAHNG